jgi:hypothetical protein
MPGMASTALRGNVVAGRTCNEDGRVVRFVGAGLIRESFLGVSPRMMEFGFARAISATADLPAIPAQIHFGFVRAISGTGGHGRNSGTIGWRGLMFGSGAF